MWNAILSKHYVDGKCVRCGRSKDCCSYGYDVADYEINGMLSAMFDSVMPDMVLQANINRSYYDCEKHKKKGA
jgi:hypothetical protein